MRQLSNRIGVLLIAAALAGCETGDSFDAPDKDYFVKYYGTTQGSQTGVDMIAAGDGTYALVGNSEKAGTRRIYFLRVDGSGNVISERYIGGPSEDVKALEMLPDGNYVILSNTESETRNIEVKLLKVRPDGSKMDSVQIGSVGNDYAKGLDIIDGNIFVSGTTDFTATYADPDPQNSDLGDFMTYRFTSDLQPFGGWITSTLGYDGYDVLTQTLRMNGEFVAFGYTNSLGNNGRSVLTYIKLSESGGIGSPYSPNSNEANVQVSQAVKTPAFNPGALVIGNSVNSLGLRQLLVCKLKEQLSTQEGDVQLYQAFNPPGANQLSGVATTLTGASSEGYLVLGNNLQNSSTSANERNNIWLSKLDYSGQVIWSASFGSEKGNDVAGSVLEMENGKILILGTTELGDTQRKLTLIKLNARGELAK